MRPYIEQPEMQNRRLDPTCLAKHSETHRLMGTRLGLDRQEAVGRVFGRFWNRTETFFRSKPGPLAGYLDPLLTLVLGFPLELDMYPIAVTSCGRALPWMR